MSLWRSVVAILLGAAAIGAVFRSADASDLGRIGGIFAMALLVTVSVGVWRGRRWAEGAAFFLGIFWLWAALALRIQGVIRGAEVVVWLAWSAAVIAGTLKTRSV